MKLKLQPLESDPDPGQIINWMMNHFFFWNKCNWCRGLRRDNIIINDSGQDYGVS